MNNITIKIKEIISKQLGINQKKIFNKSKLSENLGADSLDIIELIMSIEQEFNVKISDKMIEKIDTVEKIIQYVCTLLSK